MQSPDRSSAPRAVLHSLLFVVASAIILGVASAAGSQFPSFLRPLAIGSGAAAITYFLCYLFVKWDHLRLGDVGAKLQTRSMLRFVLGFAGGLVLVGIWAGSCSIFGQTRWVSAAAVSPRRFLFALLAYVALATREELAFRGYPLRRLEQCCGAATAQVIIALLFALEHRIGGASWLDALLGVGTGSILFGAAALATRGLAVPIGLHAAWNLGQWALGLKGEPGIWAPITLKSETEAYRFALLSYVVVTALGAFAFTMWQRSTGPGGSPDSEADPYQ